MGKSLITDILRLVGFVSLHFANYACNIMTMCIVAMTAHRNYLFVLIPVHCLIGFFCAWTAMTSIDWESKKYPKLLEFFLIFVVLGLMQFIQVKLAYDDFRQNLRSRRGGNQVPEAPTLMTARFNCKAMDGILEATAFGFVSMYTLLKHRWISCIHLMGWQKAFLYIGSYVSFLTVGLALLEVDNRTSAAARRALDSSSLARLCHLIFRSSEYCLRLLTGLALCVFSRGLTHWWITFVLIGVDYLFGAFLLMLLGGKDPMKFASLLLAIPLLVSNAMQFVDAPGMSLQARWITRIIVPFRTLELIGVIVFCVALAPPVPTRLRDGSQESIPVLQFLIHYHRRWFSAWVGSCVSYYLLLFAYALRMKPEADIHSAVANNDLDCLRALLIESELVLDINRYGPSGRTPLHLAALNGRIECMQLLLDEGANINARTGDRAQNTALHLAAKSKRKLAVAFLCQFAEEDVAFLNAANAAGDTALHVAVQRQGLDAIGELLQMASVDLTLKNKQGQRPVECIPQSKFGFDRDSEESKILAMFAEADSGRRPGAPIPSRNSTGGDMELSTWKRAAAPMLSDTHSPGGRPSSSNVQFAEQKEVPLVNVPQDVEDAFFQRSESQKAAARNSRTTVSNCGISSFMLSAGMGALSKAFLNTVEEDDLIKIGTDEGSSGQVKSQFEDFVEIKKLGEGSFGKVTLVKHKESSELFAMKIMNKAMFKAQRMTSKAISEQYILKTTKHPFIVGLNYAFQGSTFWALVMDYCPNGDLHDDLVRRGTPGLSLAESARLGGQTLLAIGHLHRINVIFRDLKLENVILDADYNAQLTDFGLAKKLDDGADAKTMCGSYGYAAPEVMMAKTYTKSVDLYSFGVMAYMMLSGGETHPEKPTQRLPPMKHVALRRKLKDAKKDSPGEWAEDDVGALDMIDDLTSEKVTLRGTAAEAGQRRFFTQLLGSSVECLLVGKS